VEANFDKVVSVIDPYSREGQTGLTLTIYEPGVSIVASGSDKYVVGTPWTDDDGNRITATEIDGQAGLYKFEDLYAHKPGEIVVTGAEIEAQVLEGYYWFGGVCEPRLIQVTAGESIAAGAVVGMSTTKVQAIAVTSTGTEVAIGIAANTTAVSSGGTLPVIMLGIVENSSWTWNPGQRVWVGESGLTQTKPTNGFIQGIGVAISAVKILVNPTLALSQSGDVYG